MSTPNDKTPAGWADPDDEDYGDEVRAKPAGMTDSVSEMMKRANASHLASQENDPEYIEARYLTGTGAERPPPDIITPVATKPYTNLEQAAAESYRQITEVMQGFSKILGTLAEAWANPELQRIAEAFPDHNSAVREILRLRVELEAKS